MTIAGLSAASAAAMQPQTDKPNPRLVDAAHEFEGSLIKEFLKPMQHDALFSEGNSGDDDEEGGGTDAALQSFGTEAMAKAISERGGFGIATKILQQLHQPAAGAKAP